MQNQTEILFKIPTESHTFQPLPLPVTTLLCPIKSHLNHREACISNSQQGLQHLLVSSVDCPGELCWEAQHLNSLALMTTEDFGVLQPF